MTYLYLLWLLYGALYGNHISYIVSIDTLVGRRWGKNPIVGNLTMGISWVYNGKSINGNTYWGFMGTGILIVGTLGEFYDFWCMYIYNII